MCGSGSVAGSLSSFWETYVSDAMNFCKILATVQGAGYNLEKANAVINFIQNEANNNLIKLKELFANELILEDKIFHSEITDELKMEYDTFCKTFPSLNDKNYGSYKLYSENSKRKCHPYLLFSSAYSNLYLGLKQAIEIDSYRYAIDQLNNDEDRTWALGALIATLSAIGNTYGGHFAQPKYKNINRLSSNELFRLIEERTLSISSEFAVRLREFALESQTKKTNIIQDISGPWRTALNQYKFSHGDDKKTLVYLDAPYTRDEYSRYYHLLETLVNYDYPDFSGIGRVPDKKLGNRFNSDFFTKTANKLKSVYTDIISSILSAGYICAWSYSDNATIPCVEIMQQVLNTNDCEIISYATPYMHQAQGGKKAKKIKEYLIFFKPQ